MQNYFHRKTETINTYYNRMNLIIFNIHEIITSESKHHCTTTFLMSLLKYVYYFTIIQKLKKINISISDYVKLSSSRNWSFKNKYL